MTGCRLTFPQSIATAELEEALFEVLAEVPSSWFREAGGLVVIVSGDDRKAALEAFEAHGLSGFTEALEPERDWVREAASLQKAVVVGRYLLDPHEGEGQTEPGPLRRLHLPASRAFGTGSHESTRLALRLLTETPLEGLSVLDVGCGAGTLAFVAALEGASRVVAFDLDPDAALATAENARVNGLTGVACFAGGLDVLRADGPGFDVAVANMILEEVAPLLPALVERVRPGGVLLTSGQLTDRREEWSALLEKSGFCPESFLTENEWLATRSIRA